MFKSSKASALPPTADWTRNLKEKSFYRYGHLRSLGISGEITALAVDPVLSLLGVGTSAGIVHIFGQSSFQFALPVSGSSSSKPASAVKFLTFHPGHHRIVAVDATNTLHSYTMQTITDHINPLTHPPLPTREASYTLWGTITAVDQPLPSHTHLFVTMKDGQMLAWDLSRGILGNWKVGNCWGEYEDKMIRSGMPGRRRTAGGPQATCLAMNPRDLNVMLIGYEGGVVAWDFQKGVVTKNFEMFLPPGAPGGGSYLNNDAIWTERTPSVTSITWRPDGQVFAVGHSDGCIAFWAFSEPDKPLMVRTITHEDVNIADAESLFDAGALDHQAKKKERDIDGRAIPSAIMANREPIFKLAWAGFPDSAAMKLLAAAQDTVEPVTNATMDFAERGETILVILGGQSPGERPGVNLLQFPAYIPPVASVKKPVGSESMPLQQRYAYRDSLMPTGASNYPTKTPPEDFVLLPRSNPYFGMAYDATALIVSLTADKHLAPVPGAHGTRAMEAFVFPPQRSDVIPPPLGRKTFVVPGEGENIVAMSPVTMINSSPGTPGTPTGLTPGWRLPWTTPSPLPSPRLRAATPNSIMSALGRHRPRARRHYRIPSSIWTGHLSVLGCELVPLSTQAFKRLISWSIETTETMPRLPLHGGLAVPDLQSANAPEVKTTKLESYRVLVTFHPDSTVRFWDTSPHLLVLPTPLRFEYPGPLPHLTISMGEYLKSPDVAHLPLARLWDSDRPKVQIKSVHLAREALECVITMMTGEIIVTKFMESKGGAMDDDVEELDDGDLKSPNGGYFPTTPSAPVGEGWVEEVTEIQHLARYSVDGFKPVAIFTLKQGEACACTVSDIGFISVAFASKSIAILDMRGPDVILREGFDEDGMVIKKKKRKNQNVQNVVGEQSIVGRLKWVVSGMGNDSTPRPRLIVSYAKGMTKIYTLVNVLGEWMVEVKPPTFTNESLSSPLGTFVLDPTTGNELTASAEALSSAMSRQATPEGKKDAPPHCLWIAASKKSIRAAVNFNGERVAKVEFEDEELGEAFYITRHGQKILVGITTTGSVLAYSLPFLQPIIRMELYFGTQGRRIGKISIDDRSGDFVEYSGPLEINIRTLFHFRKPLPPRIDPCAFKRPIPAQPVPLGSSAIPGAWMWGGAPLIGAQLDAIVAGPKRPPAPPAIPVPKKPIISWGEPPSEKKSDIVSPTPVAPKRVAVGKLAKGVEPGRIRGEREDVYSEMRNATEERGTYMDQLNESLNNVSVGATAYLQQAKNQAMKEAAKNTVKGVFGKIL